MAVTPQQVVEGLERRGLPRTAAIGLAGNFAVESGFNPGINEISPLVPGSRGGYGLAQWTGPRRRQFEAFARSQGRDLDDLDTQLDFTVWELQNTERAAARDILSAATPEEAARAVSESFLRPGIPHLDRRIAQAQQIAGAPPTMTDAQPQQEQAEQEIDLGSLVDDLLGAPAEQSAPTSPTAVYQQAAGLDLGAAMNDLLGASPELENIAQPPAPSTQDAQQDQSEGGFMRGLGLGVRDVAQGAAGMVGVAADPLGATINELFGTDIQPMREAVRKSLTDLGLPEAETATERVISSIVEGATGGLTGAGIAGGAARAASGPVSRAVASQMAAQPVAQGIGGAGGGAGQQLAAEGGAGPVGQAAATLAGSVLGGGAASLRSMPSTGQADDIARIGAQRGVRVMTSDVRPPQTFASRWALSAGEKIPLAGTGGQRSAQAAERQQAIRDVFSQFSDNPGAWSDDVLAGVTDGLKRKQSDFVQRYVGLKNEVLNNVSGAGPVPVTKTQEQISKVLQKIEGKENFRPLAAQLQAWSRDLDANTDVMDVDFMRRALGEAFKDPSLASVRTQGEELISSLYAPLRQDIDAFVAANGDPRDLTKLRVANKRLSDNMREVSQSALRSVLSKSEATPESVKRLLFSSNASDIRRLYKSLPPQGRANARAAILHDAIDRSGGLEDVSPAKFVSQLDKRSRQIGVFFSGEDKKTVEGLAKLLKATSQADRAALNPPTGMQTLPVVGGAVATDVLGGAGAGLLAVGSLGGFARVYESPAMRKVLTQMATVKPGTPAEARLIQRALTLTREMNEQEAQ